MKFSFVLSVMLALAHADSTQNEWNAFRANFSSFLANLNNLPQRMALFIQTKATIDLHNLGNPLFTMGHNIFSVLTENERSRYLGLAQPPVDGLQVSTLPLLTNANGTVPTVGAAASMDLRSSPCIGPVKNQGQCGSCWAFAAITPIEYGKCVKNANRYVAFSEQDLVDCDTYDSGCNGGWYTNAWYFLYRQNGVPTSASYPYTSGNGVRGTCRFSSNMVGASVSGYGKLPANNAANMQEALAAYGPISVAIYVSNSFFSYKSGVYNDPACDGQGVNHAVVIVGYGTLNNVPYWIVRNSWGPGWGMSGYVLMQRGVNKCSIETYPAVVLVA